MLIKNRMIKTHRGSHTAIIGGEEPFSYALMSIVTPDLKSMVKWSSKTVIFVPVDAPEEFSAVAAENHLGKTVLAGVSSALSVIAQVHRTSPGKLLLHQKEDVLRDDRFVIALYVVLRNGAVVLESLLSQSAVFRVPKTSPYRCLYLLYSNDAGGKKLAVSGTDFRDHRCYGLSAAVNF